MTSSQYGTNCSEQEEENLTFQSHEEIADESSPPTYTPTWDTIPVSKLPQVLDPLSTLGYDLRPGPRIEGREAFTTWLDQDGTATYDPNCKRDPYLCPPPEVSERIKRTKSTHPEDSLYGPKVQRVITWKRGRFEGKRLPLTLSFATDKGKAALVLYGASLDNWPKSAWRESDLDIDWQTWWNTVPTLENCKRNDFGIRRREKRKTNSRNQEICGDVELRELDEITLGHPEARGCKGCFELGQRCPLLDEGSSYPCELCIQDDYDCELILEPKKKRPCLNCGRKRINCSYREETGDHSQPCSNCVVRELKCIAGPASGRTRTGPALDSMLSGRKRTSREALARYTHCSRAKRQCSFLSGETAAKYQESMQNNENCLLEATEKTKAGSTQLHPTATKERVSLTTNLKNNTNKTHFIKTQLAHPIALNYVGDLPCQWCQDIGYGILGLGPPLEVEVSDTNQGEGYLEVSGGYFSHGADSSRMCTNCTMDRLEIAACLEHSLQDLKEIDALADENLESSYIMDYLMPGKAIFAPFLWCSVCPSPALYSCCKPISLEVRDLLGLENLTDQVGCGLKLCGSCAGALVGEKGGNLESLVNDIKEHDTSGFALRADVDLLLPGGEVVRRMGWMMTLGNDLL